ncbi:MAG: glycosyltransferase family 4 protein [Deltaproteobacteria bacterium]|nr:glycosyltransferase family 4 protein [Deltaproteobacteria bacterium]
MNNERNLAHWGIISTRLAGTDGVSLEAEKWATVFEKHGFTCFYFAGELERPPERSYLAEEAHFTHPEIVDIQRQCFGTTTRHHSVTRQIHRLAYKLKEHLYNFIEKFDIGLLLVENALTIPMNIPLGLALTELIAETNITTVAHHHDFYWERDRFLINSVSDYLNMAFPANLPSIRHVVINSYANEQLSFRTGISARVAPNIMDFDNPPPPPDDYSSDVRQALGIKDDELFILQPTRIVHRKGIEHAIELVCRLGMKAKLVISHDAGDEGYEYQRRLEEYAKLMKVDLLLASEIVDERRGRTEDGRKIYTLDDVYPYADLVTYPSTFEGFGNAFLEAVYFRKPIVVNTYSIYTKDIKPKGFSVVEIDGFVTDETVRQTKKVLENAELRQNMVDLNYYGR